jgi:hypothetical protein
MIAAWDKTLSKTIEDWEASKEDRKQWNLVPLDKPAIPVIVPPKQTNSLESPFRKIHPNVLQKLSTKVVNQ